MLRFAPSPTGLLHVGNARIALLNYLCAKKNNLKFLLRIDDTDLERSKSEYTDAIKEDLEWLGIKFDDCFFQSKRMSIYNEIAETLKKKGKLYPCYESAEELSLKRKIQLKMGKPPIYDRSSLKLTQKEKSQFSKLNKKPHWRFKLSDKEIKWIDRIHGEIRFEKLSISDPVLIRSDGTPLFTITSVIDDIDYKISSIIRGDDHITNTAAQIELFHSLDADIPDFAHFPLMKSSTGESLSKRLSSLSLREIRESKIDFNVLNNILTKLGSSLSIDSIKTVNELIDEFNFLNFSKSSIQFNYDDVFRLNSKYLKSISYEEIKEISQKDFTKEFWGAVKSNIETTDDLELWLKTIYDKKFQNKIIQDEKEFLKIAEDNLPDIVNNETWSIWTNKISDITGRKGKKLFMPLRIAITGMDKGPEMNLILPLINRKEILRRLIS